MILYLHCQRKQLANNSVDRCFSCWIRSALRWNCCTAVKGRGLPFFRKNEETRIPKHCDITVNNYVPVMTPFMTEETLQRVVMKIHPRGK